MDVAPEFLIRLSETLEIQCVAHVYPLSYKTIYYLISFITMFTYLSEFKRSLENDI